MPPTKTSPQTLQRAIETLATAKLGLSALRGSDPAGRMAGLRNLIVFGRAVTNVLQNLRSSEPEFESWYRPFQEEMAADPLMKHLYELRSRILKQGDLPVHSSLTLTGNPMAAMRAAGPAPPNAKGFFLGDRIGGHGWEVELPDGTREKYYVALPADIPGLSMVTRVHLSDAPGDLRSMDVLELAERYVDYLERMVADAQNRFRSPRPAV